MYPPSVLITSCITITTPAGCSLIIPPLHTLKFPQLRLRAVVTSLCAEMKRRCRPENGASCPVLVVVWRDALIRACNRGLFGAS
jgi:hypothetical protein